jgi:hypothetical protein
LHRIAHQVGNSDQPNQSPNYTPAVIRMRAGEHEFWRVAADTIIDLQLQYDGVAQPLQLSVAGFYGHNIAKLGSDTYRRSHVPH